MPRLQQDTVAFDHMENFGSRMPMRTGPSGGRKFAIERDHVGPRELNQLGPNDVRLDEPRRGNLPGVALCQYSRAKADRRNAKKRTISETAWQRLAGAHASTFRDVHRPCEPMRPNLHPDHGDDRMSARGRGGHWIRACNQVRAQAAAKDAPLLRADRIDAPIEQTKRAGGSLRRPPW